MNRSGPRIDPCGTPAFFSTQSDVLSFLIVQIYIKTYEEDFRVQEWQMLLKNQAEPIYLKFVTFRLFLICLFTWQSSLILDTQHLNPNWVLENIPFLSVNSSICFKRTISNTLEKVTWIEMGQKSPAATDVTFFGTGTILAFFRKGKRTFLHHKQR